MHTQCPTCKALFHINVKQFQQAQGRVRCGQCNTLFNAHNNIVLPKAGEMLTDLEAPKDSQSRTREERLIRPHRNPTENLALAQEEIPLPKLIPEADGEGARHQSALERSIAQSSSISGKPHPGFNSEIVYFPRRGAVILGLSAIVLIFLLLGQFLYFNRNQLSYQPFLASFMKNACSTIGCVIEPFRDIDRIEIISRNVFSHPSRANALMITASFANVASFAQPYPIMQVSLTDLQGKTVAARLFLPNEYLTNASISSALMMPGVPVDVSIEVLDPQNGAMAFEFAFFDRLG